MSPFGATIRGHKTFWIAIVLAAVLWLASGFGRPVTADPLGEGLSGAFWGGIVGGIFGGGNGAATGAALGGAMGVASGAARASERDRQARQHERRRQRAEEQSRWEQERLRQQRAFEMQRQQAWQPRSNSPPAASTGAMDRGLVLEVQRSLVRLGFDAVIVDGQLGPRTVESIKVYQRRAGLLGTGQASHELLRHMIQNGG